jgi:hypothetical protein
VRRDYVSHEPKRKGADNSAPKRVFGVMANDDPLLLSVAGNLTKRSNEPLKAAAPAASSPNNSNNNSNARPVDALDDRPAAAAAAAAAANASNDMGEQRASNSGGVAASLAALLGLMGGEELKRSYTLPPEFVHLFRVYGKPKPPELCWGCMIADAESVALPFEEFKGMVRLFCEDLLDKSIVAVAEHMHNYFRANIQVTVDWASLTERERVIWDWRGVDSVWHWYAHNTEASIDTFWQLYEVKMLRRMEYMHKMWKERKSDHQMVPVHRNWRVYREMTLVEHKLRSSKPSAMFAHNPRASITEGQARTLFGVKRFKNIPVVTEDVLINM